MWHSSWTTTSWGVCQKAGEAQAVLPAAAAVPAPGGCDLDAGGPEAHALTPIGHPGQQKGPGFCLQGVQLDLRGCRRRGGPPLPLLLQMAGDPGRVLFHEAVDVLLRQPPGGPHHHPAVLCDLQGQGLPAGADQFIRFHGDSIPHIRGQGKGAAAAKRAARPGDFRSCLILSCLVLYRTILHNRHNGGPWRVFARRRATIPGREGIRRGGVLRITASFGRPDGCLMMKPADIIQLPEICRSVRILFHAGFGGPICSVEFVILLCGILQHGIGGLQ